MSSVAGPPRLRGIVITGFMATGKTTIGAQVAARLGWPFIDTDAEIVRHAGKPIPAIFADEGETAFRQIEAEVTRALLSRDAQVIATGGGTLIDDETRRVALRDHLVVCLTADDDTIAARLAGEDGRPLAPHWPALLAQRRAVYLSIPHQIDTSQQGPDTVAEEIVKLWQRYT